MRKRYDIDPKDPKGPTRIAHAICENFALPFSPLDLYHEGRLICSITIAWPRSLFVTFHTEPNFGNAAALLATLLGKDEVPE